MRCRATSCRVQIVEATPHSLLGEPVASSPCAAGIPAGAAPSPMSEARWRPGFPRLGLRGSRAGARQGRASGERWPRPASSRSTTSSTSAVFLEDLLAQEGYEVRTASGAARRRSTCSSAKPSTSSLTDLVMPGMDGGRAGRARQGARPRPGRRRRDQRRRREDRRRRDEARRQRLPAQAHRSARSSRAPSKASSSAAGSARSTRADGREPRVSCGHLSLYERALGAVLDALDRAARGSHRRRPLPRDARAGRRRSGWRAPTTRDGFASPRRAASCASTTSPRSSRSTRCPPELAGPADRRPRVLATRWAPEDEDSAGAHARSSSRSAASGRVLGVAAAHRPARRRRRSATRDRAVAETLRELRRARRVANALRFRALERRSFRDPVTQAYTRAYFDDVVHNEIRKASRFGRTFSLLRIELEGSARCAPRGSEARVRSVARGVRATRSAARCAPRICSPPSPRAASACCCPRPTRSAPPC